MIKDILLSVILNSVIQPNVAAPILIFFNVAYY